MSKLLGYATAVNQTQEVICAYASGPYQPEPVASNAPWIVIGSFHVPVAVAARLVVQGFNSGAAALTVALYGPTRVANSATTITCPSEGTTIGQTMDLLPGVTYQVAVQYSGTASVGMIRTVSLGSI